MKRNLILGLALLLATGALAGCMGDDEENTGDGGNENTIGDSNCDVNMVDDDITTDGDGAALGDCETADE